MLYAMVSTESSQFYTFKSVASFLKNTHLRADDRFIVIDNDNSLPDIDGVELHRNQTRRNFAKNANFAIGTASELGTDLMFLNNDVIFSPNWVEGLRGQKSAILIPSCNQNMEYARGDLKIVSRMDWEDFAGKYELFEEIAKAHSSNPTIPDHYVGVLMPFYCVLIPQEIFKVVGFFDESFGRGGGEDVDYRIRAIKAGFQTLFSNRAYLLHFMGKSTWRSGEAHTETATHDSKYREAFTSKWGEPLAELLLAGGDKTSVAKKYGVSSEFASQDIPRIVAKLSPRKERDVTQVSQDPTQVELAAGPTGASTIMLGRRVSICTERPHMIESPDFLTSILRTRNKYLNLLEASLTGTLHGDPPIDGWSGGEYDPMKRALGRDWPALAQTMIGTARMRNLRQLCESVILNEIHGDFIETGVWRGGACIYMRGILDAYGDAGRRVFVADSFQGLPPRVRSCIRRMLPTSTTRTPNSLSPAGM